MTFLRQLLQDVGQHVVRLALPFASLVIFLQARALDWLRDPSWILILLALLLVPLLLVQRRRVDAVSIAVAGLAGLVGFALSGLIAAAVLSVAWLFAACASGRFTDVLEEMVPNDGQTV